MNSQDTKADFAQAADQGPQPIRPQAADETKSAPLYCIPCDTQYMEPVSECDWCGKPFSFGLVVASEGRIGETQENAQS